MTPLEFQPPVRQFLAAFFGSGNLLSWASVEANLAAGTLDAGLRTWLERLARVPDQVSVLPRPVEAATLWYALGHSFAQIEQLREELLAAVGPTYSNFTGYRAELDVADPVEKAVLEFTNGHAFRLRVPVDQRTRARAALDRLRGVWEQRPRRVGAAARPVGRILREFELALAVRELAEARARLDELRTAGMLDARNLLFLEIRCLAAGERWSAIMELADLSDLAQIRCPIIVADAILQAIYAIEFVRFEADGGPADAIAHFRDYALGRWSSFFRVKSTIRSPGALKLFMMLAASATPPRLELRDTILAETTLGGADRSYCESLAALLAPTPSAELPNSLAVARARHDVGDYDGAFPAAMQAPPSAERLHLLLSCAVELGRLDAANAVLEAFATAIPQVRDEALKGAGSRILWQHLVGVTTPQANIDERPPADWLVWLDRLTRVGSWPRALEVAEQGAREWDAASFLRDGARVDKFRALLANRGARTTKAQVVLRDALPSLITFLTGDTALLPYSRPVLEDLLLLLTDDAEAGAADMAAVKEVVASLVDLGPSAAEYRDLVFFLRATWERFEAPRRIDWLLESLEILGLCAAPAVDARITFAECVFGAFAKWRRHVSPMNWRVLGVLCDDIGLAATFAATAPSASEAPPNRSVGDALRGRTIVIHSLMERSASHARDALLASYPDVTVVLNADHVATPQLQELARNADLFVMVYRAAKHAATICIEAARPKQLPLLRPDGRSATAILREIHEWCARAD